MNRRTAIKLAITGVTTVGLAGCTGTSENQSTTESTESAEPAIQDLRINDEQPSEYEVSFPTGQSVDSGSLSKDEALQQVADQFAIDIQYESPVQTESTLHLEYDEDVIPKEDEDPIDQDIDTVTQQGTIIHDSQVPEDLIRYMLNGNPRNLNLTTTAQNPQTGETTEEAIALNYGNAAAETGITNEFHSANISNYDATWRNLTIEVTSGEILFEYATDAEVGSREFSNLLSAATGISAGAIENVRSPYNLTIRGNDENGDSYEWSFDENETRELIEGELNAGQMLLEESRDYFDKFPEAS